MLDTLRPVTRCDACYAFFNQFFDSSQWNNHKNALGDIIYRRVVKIKFIMLENNIVKFRTAAAIPA